MSKVELHPNIRSTDSRVTYPSAYTAPNREAAEDEVAEFLAALVRLLKPDRVLEVGTAYGHTAEVIAKALKRNGVGSLDTVEVNPKRVVEAKQRLSGLPATIHTCKYQDFRPPDTVRYGLCFFDSEWNNRDGEFRHFQSWIAPTSVLVFHDTGEQNPGGKGVARLEMERLVRSIFLPTPRGICLATLA